MKKKDLERLSEIEGRTGLEFSKYRSDELVETTADYLTFPMLVIQTAVWAALVCITVFVAATAGLYFAAKGAWGVVAFVVLGLLITGPWILIRTLSRLLRRMEADLLSLGEVGIATTRTAASDVKNLAKQTRSLDLPSPRDLFEGVMLGSLIPTVEAVVKTKIPVFGARVGSFVSGILCRISATIASGLDSAQQAASKIVPGGIRGFFKTKPSEESAPEEDSGSPGRLDRWSESIDSSLQTVEVAHQKVVHATLGRARRVARGGEGFFVVSMGGCWTVIWFFFP